MKQISLAVLATSAVLAATLTATAGCSGPAAQPRTSGSAHDWPAYAEFLTQRAAAGEFSGVVLVTKNGQPLLEKAYGMADKERGTPNSMQTKFCIASMGKMFTAVAIAQLVEQGKLSFSDPIGKYVSGFPAEIADKVTIHHLLTHTSGMGGPMRINAEDPPDTIAELMELIVKAPLQFEPGSKHAYTNDGFIVLGAIIERITGRSYADYITEHILQPAGMTDTAIRNYKPNEIPNMAHGYTRADQNGESGPPRRPAPGAGSGPLRDNGDQPQIGSPAGGGYSTAADMLRFAQALTSHILLPPALTDTVLAGKVDSNRPGASVDRYAYGFADQVINGVRIVGHDGGTPGYEGQMDIYPGRGYVVVILTNQDQVLRPAIQRSEEVLTR